jgi:signal transduction histidine kinase
MLNPFELADRLEKAYPLIMERWHERVVGDPQINGAARLPRAQFNDHIPVLLGAFAERLRHGETKEGEEEEREISEEHGRHRWQQGYDLRGMVREWGHLNRVFVGWLDENEASPEMHEQWAEFVSDNQSQAIALYEDLLQTEARTKLRDMEAAMEQVRNLERERGEILRQASHDLRGGLSVVASASNLLGHKEFPEDERERVGELLLAGIKNMTGMMGDLLDMARLEAGQEKRQIRSFDAGELLSAACRSWREMAEQKGLQLEADGPLSLLVEGDAAKVRRVAQNLALNAIKYTDGGSVRVSWGEDDEKNWFVEIADTGQGLEGSNAASLAATLQRADSASRSPLQDTSQTDDIPNTLGEGIGLSIVRRLCQLLDATVQLHSSPAGSTFRVAFPREYED